MLFTTAEITPNSQVERRLLALAAFFVFLFSIALTLSPAVRQRTWEADLRWDHWLGFAVWLVAFLLIHQLGGRRVPYRDPYLLPVAALITGWGLMTIWRVAPVFGLRQSLWLVIAMAIYLVGLRLPGDMNYLRNYKYLWLSGGLVLTALTLLFGVNPSGFGPRLWLGCCGIYFQPSEPLKLLLIMYLAAYLADRQYLIPGLFPLLAPTLLMAGLAMLLLIVQRDLGTASIFLLLYTAVVYFATGRRRVLFIGIISLAAAGVIGYLLFDVVQLRIEAWINPWLDPSGRSYQIVQSLMAVAAGGMVGRGPGLGSPTVVPVNHSDFIFASIAEETGLVGTVGLLALIAFFMIRGLRVAINAPDNFRRYLAVGLVTYLTAQSILIIGGNLRLLPLTGVTLPFTSYGGSSLVTAFLALLFLVQISNRTEIESAPLVNPRPILFLGGALLLGILALAATNSWWAYYRGPALLTRTDNPRRVIADRYVKRGAILDSQENPLGITTGEAGEYLRNYPQPELGPVLGYLHPTYGQAGMEDSLDSYLRGLEGQPSETIWWNRLLYGQPPPGSDVRQTLSPDIQSLASELMAGKTGALVLMNAESGEILAMTSNPGFNPNTLDLDWEPLVNDPGAPLVNRATQGQYHPGPILGPFLLAKAISSGSLPALPESLSYFSEDLRLDCAQEPEQLSWESAIRSGCPAAVATLGDQIGSDQIIALFDELGLYAAPLLRMPVAEPSSPSDEQDPALRALGLDGLRISPLQLVLAAAMMSGDGSRPAPQISSAIRVQGDRWRNLPPLGKEDQQYENETLLGVAQILADEELPIWQTAAVTPVGSADGLTWYLGGTHGNWTGTPLALAIILEKEDPETAVILGREIFTAAFSPVE